MSFEVSVNGRKLDEIILEYLASKEFVSVGEIIQHCAGLISNEPIADPHENYLFFLSVVKTVRSLKEQGLVEVKDVDNHLWVKLIEEG